MAIKRLVIELDDAPDLRDHTDPPASLIAKKDSTAEVASTGTPDQQEDYREQGASEKDQGGPVPEVTGRTPWDLVVAFVNQPEFMATALTFLAFVTCVLKVDSLGDLEFSDLKFPLAVAVILNFVWFGVRCLRRLRSRSRK